MPRKYKKRTGKKKKYYKRKYYKRKYYKKASVKKPEIRRVTGEIKYGNQEGLYKNGDMFNVTSIGFDPIPGVIIENNNNVNYKLWTSNILGRKIRLKYLYLKGYLLHNYANNENINAKLFVFDKKRNMDNTGLVWSDVKNTQGLTDNSATWTSLQTADVLYKYDWSNGLKNFVTHKSKSFYSKYDNINNTIPFKLRVPLYDRVMTCSPWIDPAHPNNGWIAKEIPETNAIFLSFLSTDNNMVNTSIVIKWKLYYTDY